MSFFQELLAALGRAQVQSFRCWHCDRTSYNPNDMENHYCGDCHHFCDDVEEYLQAKMESSE